jgi:diguanylate cyclase (GGDEF)-like protein
MTYWGALPVSAQGWVGKLLVALLLVACVSGTTPVLAGEGPALRIGVFESPARAPAPDVDKLPASAFRPVEAMPLTLRGDPARHRWLRIQADLWAPSDPADRWVLLLGRAGVDRMTLHWPRATGRPPVGPLDFYRPTDSPVELSNGYGFELPGGLDGPVTLYLDVATAADVSLLPQLLPKSAVIAADRDATMLFSAIYTGLVLLALSGIALFGVLRDRAYLHYTGYTVLLTLFVLAQNGHLYLVPGLAVLQSLRSLGPSLLRCLLAASMLGLIRPLLGLAATSPRVDALLRWAPLVPLALAVPCVTGWAALERQMQMLSCAVLLATVALCVLTTGVAMLQRRHLAGPLFLMWMLVLAAGIARLAVPYGLLPPSNLILYGDEIAGALSAFLLSIALADRIVEFRQQRDRARLAQLQAAGSLRIEQERRKFLEALHSGLRHAAEGDHDWMAYRRLLDTLQLLIPQAGCAVVAHYHAKEELLVCHPLEGRERYAALMVTRGVAFRGICRSQMPMQMHIEQSTPDDIAASIVDGQFAVLPLPLPHPAWGVLLIERPGGEVFSADELQLAREFAEKATAASEEAANSLALRHSAEFDGLTGAFNRRAVDLHLQKAFESARAHNSAVSVLFVDLDHLKELNDVYGHAVGDRCLRLLADTLRSHCGDNDMFGRYGGDEFVVILAGAGREQASRWAEKLLAATRPLGVECREGFARLSISIGVSSRAQSDLEAKEIVERADKALYAAKRQGRDRVQTFESLGDLQDPGTSLH